MRTLTINEMECVCGGYDLTDNPLGNQDLVPGQNGYGSLAASTPSSSSPPSSSGNGSGNNGISPGSAQKLVNALTGALKALEGKNPITKIVNASGVLGHAADSVQKYNQAGPQAECTQVEHGTWEPNANNGGGACVTH